MEVAMSLEEQNENKNLEGIESIFEKNKRDKQKKQIIVAKRN